MESCYGTRGGQRPAGERQWPFSAGLDWGALWSYARVDLALDDATFWGLTLHELEWLSLRHRRQQQREDRRAALGAWVLANVNRDTEHRAEPFDLEEVTAWLGYSGQYPVVPAPEPEEPPDVDAMRGTVEMLNTLYGGQDTRNGQR